MRKSVSFCRLQANRSKETPFRDLPYNFVCILHRKKEVIDVNLNDHFSCLAAQPWRKPDARSMDKPYSSFIGISLMDVPFLYAISIFQDVCKTTLYPFLRNEYAIIVQSKNFREVSIFICRSDFLSSTRSFLLASTVIVQVQRYDSGLWKYSATFVSSVKKHIQCF